MPHHDVLIIGAGHAGAQVAVSLRQLGYQGSIAIVGDEPDAPYERPPLSKEYFSGDKDFERILIRPLAFWTERDITLMLGRRGTAVDPAAHTVTLDDGQILTYGCLVWATGCTARRLSSPGADLQGVHIMRTRADADVILAALPSVAEVVVIGGGYIGLEAAASLIKAGKKVTVLEAQDRVLARVAGEPLSRFFEAEHRARGVDVRLNTQVAALIGRDNQVSGVQMDDGSVIRADLVLVGIGVTPAVQPLKDAGAKGENGVDIDHACRTSLPDILAVGDCAAHENVFSPGARIRIESVQNAVDQAATAARTVVGERRPYAATPWFWSNQYDLRLQTVGLANGHDRIVMRGDPHTRAFSLVYLRDGRVVALDCVNSTRDYVQGRKLVERRARADPALLADAATHLNDPRFSISE